MFHVKLYIIVLDDLMKLKSKVKKVVVKTRTGAMYCFKNCQANQN